MQKSRLFIAIPIAEEIKHSIREELHQLNPDSKLIPESNYHITVLFLGYIDNDEIESLIENLTQCTSTLPPFQLTINALIKKSNPHHHMLWVSFDYSFAFEELVTKIALSLNIPLHKKPLPHINLSRSKKKIKGPFPIQLNEMKIAVTKVELWRSILSPKGATYSSLAGFNLGVASVN